MEKDNNLNQVNFQSEQTTVNAKELLWKYFHYGWLFVLTLLLSLTAAWVYLRYAKSIYTVSSTLLIRTENNGKGGMNSQDMFADIALFQSNTNKQNEILILNSRSMMERVVRSLDLQKNYEVVGSVKKTSVYPDQPFELRIIHLRDSTVPFSFQVQFSNDWQTYTLAGETKPRKTGDIIESAAGKFSFALRKSFYREFDFRDFVVQWSPLQEAATAYGYGLEVKPANDLSNVLSLTYTHENPNLAAAILNNLMVQYNDAAIEDKNEMNRKILSFIDDRLKLVESQLHNVEGNLQKYRSSKQVIDLNAQSNLYFDNISDLNQQLRQQEVQLKVVELIEEYLNQPENRLALVPSTLGITDPTLLELTGAYNKMVAERQAELQTGATLDNPVVKNLENNINEARIKMLQNLTNIHRVYANNIRTLKNEAGAVNREISTIPQRERESRERAREQEIKQNLYLYLMQKREESEISQASTISNSRIIDNALPVFKLVRPIPLKIYGIAVMIGLLLPILIIYFLDVFNDKITTRNDISKVTSAPVLGEVGHSEEEKVLLFPDRSRTIVAEQMRILRSNLRFLLGEKFDNPTILVTSSFSGEGKSFISTNLGATLAISGKRTVILEFDLRKPKILVGLGLPKSQGLTNYLVGGAQLHELAQQVPSVENLFVIPCGPVPPNPSELLLTSRVGQLFAWLKENFDAIVIDTAPVGLVSDSFTLTQFADATLYVVRQRYTFKRQLNFIDELYTQRKLQHMGLLVNDVISKGSRGYYGYGGGRYGYGYGYGYGAQYFEVNGQSNGKGFLKRSRKHKQRSSVDNDE
jgi:tyrosine-protein kinase Etk/Wzc